MGAFFLSGHCMQISLEELEDILNQNDSFILTTHVNPDGDGLGSELALCRYLRSKGKHVEIINHSPTPSNYLWLDPLKEILIFTPGRDTEKLRETDVILVVDTNQPDRLRSMEAEVVGSRALKVIVDHHLDPHSFAKYNFTDIEATSTGEIVYRLITSFGANQPDSTTARLLYAAIMTDTGSFRYPRTDPETHRIAADLVEKGADPTEIYSNIYETFTPGRMRLLGEVLDSMKTAYHDKLAYVICKQEWFKRTGTSEADTDNFTIYPMSVQGVVVGILFNELTDGVKISFRSKGAIPINELAKEFEGNGHLNAAGARLHDVSLEDSVAKVIASAGKYIPNHINERHQ